MTSTQQRSQVPDEITNAGTAEGMFKATVAYLWRNNVYPSPAALNDYIHARDSHRLNGREVRWRREAMAELGIPYKNPKLTPYAEGRDRV